MKKLITSKYGMMTVLICLSFCHTKIFAQEEEKAQSIVRLQYHNDNNTLQYWLLESQLKKNKVFSPQKNKKYQIYLDSASDQTKIGDVVTNDEGKAKAILPPSLKSLWESSDQHTFIVKEGEEELISDLVINKGRIVMDTVNEEGVRSIKVSVSKLVNKAWAPAADIELKVGIRRMGGLLNAGEEETYTTDSSGTVTVEFKRDSLPGDQKGNIMLMARVDESDILGYLSIEKSVPWGKISNPPTDFFEQRTLWSTRLHTPYWLLFMAYSIVIAVWGTLIYLIAQLLKIKKLGAG